MIELEKQIALKVKELGGEVYYVGGYVRDEFLHIKSFDKDIEVHGIDEKDLVKILNEVGKPLEYGKSFGIYSFRDSNLDIALPRSERKIGDKHTSFDVTIDPFIGTLKASKRRDFTINALMKNVLTNEVIDHYNGLFDLENKIIRHIDDASFVEDPLRVFRACQFASRFNFKVEEKTMKLCSSIDVSTLSKERVEEELKKALLKSQKPSIFFDNLKKMNQMDYWFKGIGEGDLSLLDKAAKYKDEALNPYFFMMSALLFDVYLKDSNAFLKKLSTNKELSSYISNMYSMINFFLEEKEINNLFYSSKDPKGFIAFIKILKDIDLSKEYEAYLKLMEKDYVKGQDLIELGFKPDESFKEALDYATSLRLKGVDKKEALDKTITFLKKNIK